MSSDREPTGRPSLARVRCPECRTGQVRGPCPPSPEDMRTIGQARAGWNSPLVPNRTGTKVLGVSLTLDFRLSDAPAFRSSYRLSVAGGPPDPSRIPPTGATRPHRGAPRDQPRTAQPDRPARARLPRLTRTTPPDPPHSPRRLAFGFLADRRTHAPTRAYAPSRPTSRPGASRSPPTPPTGPPDPSGR